MSAISLVFGVVLLGIALFIMVSLDVVFPNMSVDARSMARLFVFLLGVASFFAGVLSRD